MFHSFSLSLEAALKTEERETRERETVNARLIYTLKTVSISCLIKQISCPDLSLVRNGHIFSQLNSRHKLHFPHPVLLLISELAMLTCIACTKQLNTTNNGGSRPQQEEDEEETETPRTKQATKSLTSQVKY